MTFKRYFSSAVLLAASLALAAVAGCASEEDEGILPNEGDVQSIATDPEAKFDRAEIPFTTFTDTLPSPDGAQYKVFTSANAYRRYFGHAAPSTVNFAAGDWVALFDAGRQNTGGFAASITSIRRTDSGYTLKIYTQLRTPGAGCPVTLALTRPYVLARFRAPTVPRIGAVRFYRDDVAAPSCIEPTSPCDTVRCAAGTHCEERQIVCITTPCNPIAECVPDAPTDPCAVVRCASGTRCVSQDSQAFCVPNDRPTCEAMLCAPGSVCVNTASGGQCRPTLTCATVLCAPDTRCVETPTGPSCQPIPPPGGCNVDADCRLYDQYCPSNPCGCEVLGFNQRPATCSNPVQCFRQPCQGRTAACVNHACVVQ